MIKIIRKWLAWHSIQHHLLVPIWSRIPERARWWVVDKINKRTDACWVTLTSAALYPSDGDDPCDGCLPTGADASKRCATQCMVVGGRIHQDHIGTHTCECYCGKFQFSATFGADERTEDGS